MLAGTMVKVTGDPDDNELIIPPGGAVTVQRSVVLPKFILLLANRRSVTVKVLEEALTSDTVPRRITTSLKPALARVSAEVDGLKRSMMAISAIAKKIKSTLA